MSDLVGNPEDRFSRVETPLLFINSFLACKFNSSLASGFHYIDCLFDHNYCMENLLTFKDVYILKY